MKLNYFPDTDTLCIDLVDRPSVDSDELSAGVVLDMDADGNIVGIEIEHAKESGGLQESHSVVRLDLEIDAHSKGIDFLSGAWVL